MNLQQLLQIKQERDQLEAKIKEVLLNRYQIIDQEQSAPQYATAGNVYNYLSDSLNISNNSKFRNLVKPIILSLGVRSVKSSGYLWFKGLSAQEEDLLTRESALLQNRLDKRAYKERKRLSATTVC
jgi:hypothetical protein